MDGCVIHISDLHCGAREAPEADDALVALVAELAPELVVASGDLSNRGRVTELERARALLERVPAPVLAVPGNHDIPYTPIARAIRPWRPFEAVFGTTSPVVRTEHAVACGLNSVRPWRHQGGRLTADRLESAAEALADAPAGALRIVVCHHHLASAPWRASRKFPLKHRDAVLAALAAAGTELVLGGHIHQSSTVERHEFEALDGARRASLVLTTAPGFGRPRPHRPGEANGLHVVRWSETELQVETYIWDGVGFRATGARTFPRP